MRRKQKPKKNSEEKIVRKKRAKYSEESLFAAWKAVEGGMTMYRASQIFGIPKQTLGDRKAGKIRYPEQKGSGKHTIFEKIHEEKLINQIRHLASLGYGYSRAEVIQLATDYAHFLTILSPEKKLSNGWLNRFYQRWPEILSLRSRNAQLPKSKHDKPGVFDKYFSELKTLMDRYELHGKPQCIYNVDEIGITADDKPGRVVVSKRSKPGTVPNSKSLSVIVIACGNAIGSCIPPFIIFKGKKMLTQLSQKCSPGTRVRTSENGWSNNILFKDFIKNHFLKFTMGSDSDYRLVLYDGHASHINSALIDWAKEHRVILFVVPPHRSQLTQPLDVGCFGPFKKFMKEEAAIFEDEAFTADSLCEVVCRVYPKSLSHQNLVHSFRKTGIYPLDPGAINSSLLTVSDNSSNDTLTEMDFDAFFKERTKIKHLSKKFKKKRKEKVVKIKDVDESKNSALQNQNKLPPLAEAELDPVAGTSTDNVASSVEGRDSDNSMKPSVCEIDSSDVDYNNVEFNEEEKCCVCGLFEPVQTQDLDRVVLVHWAQCDTCPHWVHLKFCEKENSIANDAKFFCPHCRAVTE